LLLVAAAAFVWINFFSAAPDSPVAGPTVETPAQDDPRGGASADGDAVVTPAEDGAPSEGDAAAPGDRDPASVAQDGVPIEGDVAAPAPDGEDGPPTVVAEPAGSVVGRDVVVAELPFLVTEPPAPDEAAGDDEAAAAEAGRPGGALRASVNPFSPIVVQQPEVEASAAPDTPNVVGVPEAPDVQEVVAEAPSAPAPRPLAPNSPRTTELPRALPRGTLPIAPDLLTGARAEQAPRTPANLPTLAAVREPADPGEPPELQPVGEAVEPPSGADPTPLAPGAVPAAGVPDRPLVSGADSLSRYLRDRNVSFTGSVLGSVGVGVFRLSGQDTPLVLALGQNLPDTEIVLTDLRGQAAEFTLGDTTHVLNLDLRR
jgi:hypothetical protein